MATTTVQKEVIRRGVFGHIIKWLFILFNILMVIWLISYFTTVGEVINESTSEAEKAGAGIGAMLGTGSLLMLWALVNVILVPLVFLTRRKELVTITRD